MHLDFRDVKNVREDRHLIIDDIYIPNFFYLKNFKSVAFKKICMVIIIWELINHFLAIAKTSVLFSTVVPSIISLFVSPFTKKTVVLVKQLVIETKN